MLNNLDLFETPPSVIHYCYGAWQQAFKTMQERGIVFHEGIPETRELIQWFPQRGLLIIDDLMNEGSGVLDLFTKYLHHQNLMVFFLCQYMLPTGKYAKRISRNAHYVITFKNPRDQWGCATCCCNRFPRLGKTPWKCFAKRHPALSVIC